MSPPAITVDEAARTAQVPAGVTWAELDAATQRHGLAAPGPRVSRLEVTTTVADGPSGWFDRPLGPRSAGLLTTEHDRDGVVLRLHAVGPQLLCGFLAFPRGRAREVASVYRELIAQAPTTVGGGLVLFAGRGGACNVVYCSTAPAADAEPTLRRLRELAPSLDAVALNDYRAFQAMSDMHNPAGAREERRYGTLASLTDATLGAALDAVDRPAAALSHLLLLPGEGTQWTYECAGLWPPVTNLDRGSREWVSTVAGALTASGRSSDTASREAPLPTRAA